MARSYQDECSYLEQLSSCSYRIKKGFVPNMNVSTVYECSPGVHLSEKARRGRGASMENRKPDTFCRDLDLQSYWTDSDSLTSTHRAGLVNTHRAVTISRK